MLNHTAIADQHMDMTPAENVSKSDDTCSALERSHKKQGLILGSFFWGYIATGVVAGLLAQRYGGKMVFLWSMLLAAICTLLCPLAAKLGYGAFMAMRMIIGLGEGVAFPCMHTIWSRWAPPLERSVLTGLTYAGTQIGIVLTFPLSGFMCNVAGWASVFYLFGGLGILWCIAWFLFASDKPSSHRRITAQERVYIESSLRGQVETKTKYATPWMSILASPPVWAIIVAHTSANFGTYLVLTTLPTFMNEVLNFDIKSNGLYSACPYIAYFISINAASHVADFLRRRKCMSTGAVRKLMLLIALCGQSIFLVATGYLSCGQSGLAVVFISIAQGISGLQWSGVMVNHVDIAPKFAGTLFGLSNMFATISGIVAPYIAAVLTVDRTLAQWRAVFYLSAAVLTFGAVFFAFFASGELQPWATVEAVDEVEMDDLNNDRD